MEGYKAVIKESSRPLTAKERIMYKDTSNVVKLDEVVTPESPFVFKPVMYVVLAIHNEKSDNVDYDNYVIIDDAGNRYITGSESFWHSFKEIWDEMAEANEEDYQLEIYKKESKNYKGKQFITCSVI